MKNITLISLFLFSATLGWSQKRYEVFSPDKQLKVSVKTGNVLSYALLHKGDTLIYPSSISMILGDGEVWGPNSKVRSVRNNTVNKTIASPFYKRAAVTDHFNEMTLVFKNGFNLIFRMYNEGMAYRFVSSGDKPFTVVSEEARFHFQTDRNSYIPYVRTKSEELEKKFFNSFENIYTYEAISRMNPHKLLFSPMVVETGDNRKLCIAEADLEQYPGMFLVKTKDRNALEGVYAPYPKEKKQGGYNSLQEVIQVREPYIASCQANAVFPWRIVVVSENDKELADNDMVYKLAAPSRVKDISWIRPGKVAWEWWNAWNLKGVDFKTGVNNETYMAYIDFASRHGVEYVILDEGWAVNLKADLFQVVPEVDLKKLINYAASRNVGLILWAGYYAFNRDLEKVCKHYSELGIKGFKVDFMDRDDQPMVEFYYKAAEIAAKHRLLLDFHGAYKPTGLNRTYPNVLNFEGVHGLEQLKFTSNNIDQVTYDVTIPFIRMLAGPMDYTQGAMRNANKKNFRYITEEPMSQGTRCRQLAEYVVFESPLNMLCDSPSMYEREAECTSFITSIPTVWDHTISLDGAIGKYVAIARKKGKDWYVGAMTNWDERTLTLDLSFVGEGAFAAEVYRDGANAHRVASDYVKEVIDIPADRKLKISMAPGGGCAMKIYKKP